MAEELPTHRTQRISLSKSQLRTELGAELLSLCQTATVDGTLSEAEVADLRLWLDDSKETDLPAASYLREVVTRILADGVVTADERKDLYKAVETVLPPEIRRDAKAARRSLEKQEAARNRPIDSANFMVAGCRYEGRPEVIQRHARAEDAVTLIRDKGNRFSRHAIAVLLSDGQQIGFMPDDDAQGWAPEMDQGARAAGRITKILTGGRSPIPVVQAYLLRPDAEVAAPAVVQSPAIAAADPPRSSVIYWLQVGAAGAAITGLIYWLNR